MNVLVTTASPRRGTELLLRHCAAVSRPSAAERLSEELGGDLSRRLVEVLTPSYRVGRRLRGSSSP
jgi:hypothetical protein